MLSIYSKYLKFLSVIVIIAFGIFIRTHVFLQGVSFYGDEGLLISNLYEKNYLDLFLPLKYHQQVPPVFLVLSKFILTKYGLNEIALRLIPYVASVISVILFYFLCNRLFKKPITAIAAVLLFSFNLPLVEFSQILKPYSSDVLFSILTMFIALNLDFEKINVKKTFGLSLLAVLSFWCSYTMVIIIFSYALLFLIRSFLSKDYAKIRCSIIFLGVNSIGAFLYYFINLHGAASSRWLYKGWADLFGFFPNTYVEFLKLNHFIFNIEHLDGLIITSTLLVFGIFFFKKQDSFKFWVVVSPLIGNLFLSAIHVYPFSDRAIIYLIPNIIIIMVVSLDSVELKNNIFIVSLISAFIFLTHYIPFFIEFIKSGTNYEKAFTRDYVLLLKKEKIDKNSIIFLSPQINKSFDIYAKGTQLSQYKTVDESWINPIEDLNKLPHKSIIYFYLAHNRLDPVYEKNFTKKQKWIDNNCKILKEIKNKDKRFIKCYVK